MRTLVLCAALTACGATIGRTTYDTALFAAYKVYREQGLACVEKATTKDEATACTKQLEEKWQRVWTSWDDYDTFCAETKGLNVTEIDQVCLRK